MRTILMQGFLWLWLCLLNINLVNAVIPPGYLDFDNLPDTNFSCVGKVIGGYYADLETSCQMFHVCTIGQLDEPMDIRFLCLNGTVFDQETRVCERVDEVDCTKSEKFYSLNLELYGNTAPPIVEEPEPTETPKKTTTTTTTPKPITTAPTRPHYFTTLSPTIPTTPTHGTPKVITSHQFPVHGGPDIRFNPEEINIKLTPGSPPIIKGPSVTFQQQKYDSDPRVTTHSSIFKEDRPLALSGSQTNRPGISSNTQKPKSVVSYGLQHTPTQNYHYDYNYPHTETSEIDYRTDLPGRDFIFNTKLGEFDHPTLRINDYQSTQHVFTATATKTPFRNENPQYASSTAYPSSLKPPQIFQFQRTDKPPQQLPIPLLPTLPPLTFSSPAPFTLTRHFETKRSNDHQLPRVVVSASASVSDASGRKVNYSLGTIGASLLGKAPSNYDEYKEDDVGLDPFYHDVPKLNRRRRKREVENVETTTKLEETTTESNVNDRVEITTENIPQTTHWLPPDYVDDNYEGQTYDEQSKTNTDTTKNEKADNTRSFDYVDDNYEPIIYKISKNEGISTEIPESTTYLTGDTNSIRKEIYFNNPQSTEHDELYQNDEEVLTTTEFEDSAITESTTEALLTTEINVEEGTTNSVTGETNLETTTKNQELSEKSEEESTTTDSSTQNISIEDHTTISNDDTTYFQTTIPSTTEHYTTKGYQHPPEVTLNPSTERYTISTRGYYEQSDGTESTETTPQSIRRYSYGTRGNKRYGTKPTRARHRFSSPTIHLSQSVLKLQGNKLIPFSSTTESSIQKKTYKPIYYNNKNKLSNKFVPTITIESTTNLYEDVPMTDAALSKSVNPTEAKDSQTSPLPTTPLSKTSYSARRFLYDSKYSFTCIDKETNRFYEDPRDCRLFHYCTPGYTDTQVLDMKFVCDFGTYFDLDKLICTKHMPLRCT